MEKEKIECCSENQVHPDLLKIVNDTMPEETELYLSLIHISEPTRH